MPFAATVGPVVTTPTWPPKPLSFEHHMLDVLTGLLDIEPAARVSCARAEAQVTASVASRVVWANVSMQRGLFSVAHGRLEDHTLRWLQADPSWSELRGRAGGARASKAQEAEFKHEEGGYTGRQAPGCKVCNALDMGRPYKLRG